MFQKANKQTREAHGVIVLLQEDRFRLETPDGRSLLLIMGPRIGRSLDDLDYLAHSHTKVQVKYTGEPDAGAVAVDVRPD